MHSIHTLSRNAFDTCGNFVINSKKEFIVVNIWQTKSHSQHAQSSLNTVTIEWETINTTDWAHLCSCTEEDIGRGVWANLMYIFRILFYILFLMFRSKKTKTQFSAFFNYLFSFFRGFFWFVKLYFCTIWNDNE